MKKHHNDNRGRGRDRGGRESTVHLHPDPVVQSYLNSLPPDLVKSTLDRAVAIGVRVIKVQRGGARVAWVLDELDAIMERMSQLMRGVRT